MYRRCSRKRFKVEKGYKLSSKAKQSGKAYGNLFYTGFEAPGIYNKPIRKALKRTPYLAWP